MMIELMNSSIAGKVLMIIKHEKKVVQELSGLLQNHELVLAIEHNLGAAIHRAQNTRFDVIVLDANMKAMPIEQMIQIFRDISPGTRIIVKTRENSKELEAKVRREKIYYYHLDSFGSDDLKLAIKSALNKRLNLGTIGKQTSSSTGTERKILMVDENDEFIEIHRSNLENHGFEVDVCFNADEAFLKVKQQLPDLIMIDMDIPVGSDGLHFVEKMMNDAETRKMPMLLYLSPTRMSLNETLVEKITSTLPTWAYLEKPVRIEDVIPKIELLLNPKVE